MPCKNKYKLKHNRIIKITIMTNYRNVRMKNLFSCIAFVLEGNVGTYYSYYL